MSVAALLAEKKEKAEAWRYTSLDSLTRVSFSSAAVQPKALELPGPLAPARLVFVNGAYRQDLSTLKGLPEAFQITTTAEGLTLSLENNTCLILQPIETLFFCDATPGAFESEPLVHIRLGPSCRLTLLERHIGSGGAFLIEPHFVIELAAQAKLMHGKSVRGDATSVHIARTDIAVAAGAFYDAISIIESRGLTRCQTDVALQGALAAVSLTGVNLLDESAKADILTNVRHEAPHGTSRQSYKSVLTGKAHGVFQGQIYVAPKAQKTDGYQLSRALLLSDQAEMDAKPALEIYADDVKCSHGSAMGDLDEESLFYLRSRGLPEKEARSLLIEAFATEDLDRFCEPDLAQLARREIEAWLKRI